MDEPAAGAIEPQISSRLAPTVFLRFDGVTDPDLDEALRTAQSSSDEPLEK